MNIEEPPILPEGCGGNAAPYVLGALIEEEYATFVRHMESCAVCREEVAALQVVTAALPASAPQVHAPPELKRQVMASVHEDVRGRRSAESSRATGERSRSHAWFSWRPALAVGAVAAVAAVVVALVAIGSSTSGSAGGTRVIQAQVIPERASASLNVSGGRAELKIAGMPQSAPGRVYEVWVKRAGGPMPTDALFTVSSGGAATVAVPGGVSGVKEVMVTSEPKGGSRAPTTLPLIVARVS
jgi:anti-sigma-K factor RskA